MKTNDGTQYTKTTDSDGNEYYCPIETGNDTGETLGSDIETCVEAEVAERYAGIIGRMADG